MQFNVKFLGSYPNVSACPESKMPEYAFIGRSNVGKSSLINMITANKKTAKVSNTPGKTRLINLFDIDQSWMMADLPGYGYAKVSKSDRKGFSTMIKSYLKERANLALLFVLIDVRLEPQAIDLEFLDFCGLNNIPISIVFTKADKLKTGQISKNTNQFLKTIKQNWETLPKYFLTSSQDNTGRIDLISYILSINGSIGKSE